MKINQAGINLIKKYEGCVPKVYIDAAGVKTCGYGHTGADVNLMTINAPISQQMADTYLLIDIGKAEKKVDKYDSVYHFTENEYSALVSFAFNIGNIDELTKKGTRTKNEIAEKIPLYNKAGGKVLAGLTKRRNEERAMFINDGLRTVYPVLKYGSRGAEVKYLQHLLNVHGFGGGHIAEDGVYGPVTRNCVIEAQGYYGLKKDAIAGPLTFSALENNA